MAEQLAKLKGLKILLGVTGGVAAYKAVDLASRLTGSEATVKVIMTECACKLIGPKSFEAVTGQPVYTSMWSGPEECKIGHINLADWAEVVVVAPATANIIAKTVCGICDDLLSSTLCVSWGKPVLFAPAMNSRMWTNPVVQKNIETLRQLGIKLAGPEEGRLACGSEGIGRMTEPAEIMKTIENIVSTYKPQ